MRIASAENQKEIRKIPAYELVLSVCLSLGCWGSLFSMFGSAVPFGAALFTVAALPVLFVFLCRRMKNGRFLAFYVILSAAALFLILQNVFMDGLLQGINLAIEHLNSANGTGYLLFETPGSPANAAAAFIVCAAAVSAAIGQSAAIRQVIPGFVFTAAPVTAGIAFRGTPSVWMLLLLIFSWTALFLLASPAGRIPVLLAVTAVLGVLSLLFTGTDWKSVRSFDEWKENFVAWEEGLRFGGNEIEGLSRGDLGKTHPLEYDESAVFRLRMQRGQSLYLRGFAGADYADDKWSETDDTAYSGDFRGLGQYLADMGYYPWCQQNSIYRLKEDYTFNEIEVENRQASSKYMWLPYETAVAADADGHAAGYDQDRIPLAEGFTGKRNYTLRIFDSGLKEYTDAKGAELLEEISGTEGFEEYLENEEIYRSFVYRTYMGVPPEYASLLEGLGVRECRGKALDYCLYTLRNRFTEDFVYNTETEKAPDGRKELEYFLTDGKSGSCMHFATAAVLFLREAGFPARYAEGYYISPKEILLYEDLENVELEVPDSDSHAWAEVYVDALGWMPVEVTPGFYDMELMTSDEPEITDDLPEVDQFLYVEQLPLDQAVEPVGKAKEGGSSGFLIPLLIILFVILYYVIRRLLLRRKKNMRGIFRYLAALLGNDGIHIKKDPYAEAERISEMYDPESSGTGLSYRQAMKMIYRERFGGGELNGEELERLTDYARGIAGLVYRKVPWYKKLWMRFGAVLV